MKSNTKRLSFDIPESEHHQLKQECVKAKMSIKDFAHAMLLRGLEELKKKEFRKSLEEAIRQSKKGQCRIISDDDLDKMFDDAE